MDENEYKEIEEKYTEILDQVLAEYDRLNLNIKAVYVPEGIKALRRMKKFKEMHLLFLKDFSVFFDNNEAERQVSICKIHKKYPGNALP